MARKNNGVRSLPEKEVEVVSDDVEEKLIMIYGKPVMLYGILQTRLQYNVPYFLPRCLSYKIQAKKKKKTNSGGKLTFNYMDCNNKFLKSEDKKDFSCSFCSTHCGDLEAVKLHLTSSHDIFEYNVRLSETNHPKIDVSLKPDAIRFGELSDGLKKHHLIPFTFCSKRRKRQRDDRDKKKRPNVRFLEMDLEDLPRDTENELVSHVSDDNLSTPAKAHSSEKTSDILTITQPEIGQSSEPKVPLVSRRKMLYAARSKAKSIERLKKREFYHSKTYQPMSFAQVMSDADSETEVDDEVADIEERMRLNQLVKVSDEDKRFMFLWNSFVRKQRVIAYGHVPWACEEFIKLHEKELISSQSHWRWRLFMIKLWNHGLICGKTIDKCNTFLENSQAAATAAAATAAATAAAATATTTSTATIAAATATATSAATATAAAAAAETAAAAASLIAMSNSLWNLDEE